MKNLSKVVIFLFVSLSLSILYTLFSMHVFAQVPDPIIPCADTEDPEFNSLRPYQASPCGNAPQSKFCGNKIIITETETRHKSDPDINVACPEMLDLNSTAEGPWENGSVNDPKDYWIDLSEVELPILGNTEDVQNSQNPNDQLNDAQKMNEYVSWYLNGVINRAEYGESKNTATELVNFSGPINKLMPSMILEAQRIESIENAAAEIGQPMGSPNPELNSGPSNHNQIVVCGQEQFLNILGQTIPNECYQGNNSSAKNEVYRLKDWGGDLSWFLNITNAVGTDVWNKRSPPLPWSNMKGKPFENDILYHKAYNEWKGKSCAILPIVGLVCIDNPFIANKWADLYPYIPLSNTADKQYKMPIYIVTVQGTGSVVVPKESIIREQLEYGEPILFYPHAYEVRELSEFLNKTYSPSGSSATSVDPKLSEINSYNKRDPEQCRTIEVRANAGDDLFPINERINGKGDIGVGVYFKVNELPRVSCDYNPISQEWKGTFYGEVSIEIHTDPVQIPNADQIWQNTVSGASSTVKRIFPKIEKGSPIECLADIPTVSKAVYKPVEGTDKIGVKSLTNPEEKYDPLNAKLYFPHLGSVYEYFLKGIQTALRPKGYGDPIPNGLLCRTDEEEEEDMCPVVPDSEVSEKFLGDYKLNYLDLADRWTTSCSGPDNNLAEECYNYVVSESQKANVNPAFSLTMWLEESDASNYCAGFIKDFGIVNSEVPTENIVEQLKRFLSMAKGKYCTDTSGFIEPMHNWLSRFQAEPAIQSLCDPSDSCGIGYTYGSSSSYASGKECVKYGETKTFIGILTVWKWVNDTVLGNCASIDGQKFVIQWPTDMSCP